LAEGDTTMRHRVTRAAILALFGVTMIGCAGGGDRPADESVAAQPESAAPLTTEAEPLVITAAELAGRLDGPDVPVILDVRSPEEFAEGHIPGAINVPYDQVGARLGSLEPYRDAEVVVYCRTGRRAGVAEEVLREAGFESVVDLEGHMTGWSEAGLPVAVPAAP